MSTGPQVEINYDNIPPELRARKRWVLWGVDPDKAKVPYQVANPARGASSANPLTWGTFETARCAVELVGDAQGIGYEITPDDGLVAVDFDHCLDAAGSLLEPFATWYKTMPGYWELSQSGTGLHGFVHGTLPAGCGNKRPICPGDKTDKREVELYIKERYIAMTGALWGPQTPLADAPSAQAGIDAIIEQTGLLKGNGPADTLPEIDDRPAEELDAILQSALQRDLDFAQLYTNTDHSGDESTADHALVCAACRAVNFKLSAGDLQRILDASPWVTTKDAKHLQKWQERTDYVPRTIREAWAASATKEADKMEGFKSLAPEKPRFVTAAELDRMELPPVQWAVPGLLPAGLVFLVAAPKMGKSWLAFDLCLSVAAGDEWLGHKTNQGATLYLALEDGLNRLQARLRTIGDGFTPPPAGCTLAINAPMLNAGLLEFLDGWLTANPDAKLVCIDTFQKIKPPQGRNENAYGADYRICSPLQAWAIQHNICVLLVHHTKKGVNPGDIFEGVNGSQGLTGTADATLLLSKENRFDADAVLSITGRDVEMERYLMHFDAIACRWVMLGTVENQERQNFQACPAVKTIKELTEQGPWKGTITELADEVLARYPDAPLPETAAGLRSYFGKIWPLLKSQGVVHTVKRDKKRLHVLESAK